MPQKPSDVDVWLQRETPRVRQALESASRYFDASDNLTVNTLEAIYAKENSFGTMLGERGSANPAGHFHLSPDTAKRYGLTVSKTNDQRFNVEYASSAAARYLKDLHTIFSKGKKLLDKNAMAVSSISERKKFVLAAYNAGEGRIASAQKLTKEDRKNPQVWSDVEQFLPKVPKTTREKVQEIRHYVEIIPIYEAEFARKSPANKNIKHKNVRKELTRCTEGHWRTIDDRPVFICD